MSRFKIYWPPFALKTLSLGGTVVTKDFIVDLDVGDGKTEGRFEKEVRQWRIMHAEPRGVLLWFDPDVETVVLLDGPYPFRKGAGVDFIPPEDVAAEQLALNFPLLDSTVPMQVTPSLRADPSLRAASQKVFRQVAQANRRPSEAPAPSLDGPTGGARLLKE